MKINNNRVPPAWKPLVSATALLLLPSLAGCSRSPTFNLLGSYFPSWIICLAIGGAVTLLVHRILSQRKLINELWPLPIVYPSLFLFVTCTLWLCFFS